MRSYLQRLVFALLVTSVVNECRVLADPCEGVVVPPNISSLLGKSFADWRLEKLSDLGSSERDAWTKRYPTACPGFAAGHFQEPNSVGYAFLLVPAKQTKKGYRLVVFVKTEKGSWRPIILEKNDQHTPETTVIGLAAAGDYEEAERAKKIHIRTDAIFSEDIGVGVMVYYWHVDRFRSLVISD